MNCKNCVIDNVKPDKLMTELRFCIASARASGFELIRLGFLETEGASDDAKLEAAVFKKLRALKKEGVIQFFASSESFSKHTTEAIYLLNKYPELAADEALSDSQKRAVFVRL